MTSLSDPQLVILSAAAQRADLSVLPLPDSLKVKGGALNKVIGSLRKRGLIRVLGGDGGPERVVITREGMAAIGVEPEGEDEPTGTDADARSPGTAPAAATDADGAAMPAKSRRAKGKKAKKAAAAVSEPGSVPSGEPTARPTPRAGTKQAQMIDMLKRPEGATVEQIAAATGWQRHTIRGAISGALKKKLGLTVEATRTCEVGPNKTGAKGSATVYRIVGSGTETALRRGLMICKPRPGRYRLHGLDSPEAEAVLAEQGLSRAEVRRALAELERTEGTRIPSIVGINDDGVFGSAVEGWRPDLPDACKEPFVPLLWLKILELLGRVPEGSTARFLEEGILPG